ncbi:ester cyclase [Providencia rustigianii]|uniref:ester cyclase n=1 Tax=Providencia rustigianii TaxID=158850 RepID=UPI0038B3F0CB
MDKSLASIVKTAARSLFEQRDIQSISQFFSQDYVVHLTNQDYSNGYKIIEVAISQVCKTFPEIQVEVEILVEGRDRVAWQRTLRGVQKHSYKGFPASNRQIIWRDMVVSRFDDGLIVEEWLTTDLAEQLLLSRKG